jgi:ketosteroid isomerase-like protein
MDNISLIEKVPGVYAASGRGGVPAILEILAEDIDWDDGHGELDVPWLAHRRGRTGAALFAAAAEHELTQFAPHTVFGSGLRVVALVDVAARVRRTGRSFAEQDEIHPWTFDARGLVTRVRHGVDTHKHVVAWPS